MGTQKRRIRHYTNCFSNKPAQYPQHYSEMETLWNQEQWPGICDTPSVSLTPASPAQNKGIIQLGLARLQMQCDDQYWLCGWSLNRFIVISHCIIWVDNPIWLQSCTNICTLVLGHVGGPCVAVERWCSILQVEIYCCRSCVVYVHMCPHPIHAWSQSNCSQWHDWLFDVRLFPTNKQNTQINMLATPQSFTMIYTCMPRTQTHGENY